jgi:hypothetical protein
MPVIRVTLKYNYLISHHYLVRQRWKWPGSVPLLDHLVGAPKQRQREREAESLCGTEIDG